MDSAQEEHTGEQTTDQKESQVGVLFLVATPIGNREDITLRALKVLKAAEIIVCEDPKVAAPLLRYHGISKPLEVLNEHNERRQTEQILGFLQSGKKIALISDAGLPVVADPGFELVQRARELGIEIVPVPGASAITTALMVCGLPVEQFLFAGFLSRIPALRKAQLQELAQQPYTIVILETPYRLLPLLRSAAEVVPDRQAYIGCNLTLPSETHHYGTVRELLQKFERLKFKGEFVFCFAGLSTDRDVYRNVQRQSARHRRRQRKSIKHRKKS